MSLVLFYLLIFARHSTKHIHQYYIFAKLILCTDVELLCFLSVHSLISVGSKCINNIEKFALIEVYIMILFSSSENADELNN